MSQNEKKFQFKCRKCGNIIADFKSWFDAGQICSECGNKWIEAEYTTDYSRLSDLINSSTQPENLWHYFDFLPLNEESNQISSGEGVIPAERWEFLEKYARDKYNTKCEVYAYRNDLNPGTGTFKDVAAAVAASVLKENGVKQYSVASTGNIATAFSHYLTLAGINLAVFIPNDALKEHESEISSYGQQVFRINGDYAKAKQIAAEYSKSNNILLSGGNIDPMRVEAKKTMVFEWLRQMKKLPTVYVQALSGGTGPIAIDKGIREIKDYFPSLEIPRFIMVQPSNCDPMTAGWITAKQNNFPNGWLNDYPIYENPVTKVPTLATGNPATFPIIADLVKNSCGEIISFDEEKTVEIARIVAYEKSIQIGPASSVALGGFFDSLKKDLIKDGDIVMVNVGEGVKRAASFMEEMIYTTKLIDSIDDCFVPDREKYKSAVWKNWL